MRIVARLGDVDLISCDEYSTQDLTILLTDFGLCDLGNLLQSGNQHLGFQRSPLRNPHQLALRLQ